jgi:hypothetical protein
MIENRKLAAILVADVVGYSRLAGADEERTLARLRGLVKRTGDGSIIDFRSVVDAVRCAVEVQTSMIERNAGVPRDRRIEFRIGIHLGDVVEEADGDLMVDGVISPRGWKASRSPARSACPKTLIGRSRAGSILLSAIWAQRNSRTSPNRSASIRLASAILRRRGPRRVQPPKNPPRRASRSSFCRSPTSAATRNRSISSTGSRRV